MGTSRLTGSELLVSFQYVMVQKFESIDFVEEMSQGDFFAQCATDS